MMVQFKFLKRMWLFYINFVGYYCFILKDKMSYLASQSTCFFQLNQGCVNTLMIWIIIIVVVEVVVVVVVVYSLWT